MDKKNIKNIKAASFTVLALSFCSLLVFLANQEQKPTLQAKALKRAEIYAQRMVEKNFMRKVSIGEVDRSLASIEDLPEVDQEVLEGPVGLDPWGHTFSFMVKKSPKNQKKGVVVIWSSGKDSKLETTRDMIAENHMEFKGDDFGAAIPFTLK